MPCLVLVYDSVQDSIDVGTHGIDKLHSKHISLFSTLFDPKVCRVFLCHFMIVPTYPLVHSLLQIT